MQLRERRGETAKIRGHRAVMSTDFRIVAIQNILDSRLSELDRRLLEAKSANFCR
jgi:hypothetical protein